MREWTVGGAIIESADGLCLVRNRRRNGSYDWSPPGGVIEHGEDLVVGLTREVAEETGLIVSEWTGPLYTVRIEAPDMGWDLTVEVHRALGYSGELAIADPDGIVVDVGFHPAEACADHLTVGDVWVREPVLAWLEDPWSSRRHFGYVARGTDRSQMVVERR